MKKKSKRKKNYLFGVLLWKEEQRDIVKTLVYFQGPNKRLKFT